MNRYDYEACRAQLEYQGKAIYGPKFRLYPADEAVITQLLAWALRDEVTADKFHLDLHKGLLLTGPVGCGKTSLMSLLRPLLPPAQRYAMKPCREIAFEFASEGYPVISRYSRQSFHPAMQLPAAICFDDLGLEATIQYFGNSTNTMAEILLSRYDYFISHHMITHITSNLNSAEIGDRYGARVRSRMREQFNLVAFDGRAGDKRK
jgi:energy-coupling factor transporter ATP-binding protein EcfA2